MDHASPNPLPLNRSARMREALASLNPNHIEITDESEKHKGHGGWRQEGETHFKLIIRAEVFAGQSRVAIHRLIQQLLQKEFQTGLHALAIDAQK